jgi:hypothetical protein
MIKRIERRVEEDGLFELRRFAAITGYWLEMSHARSDQAEPWIRILEEVIDPTNAYNAGRLAGVKAWSGMVNGDRAEPCAQLWKR